MEIVVKVKNLLVGDYLVYSDTDVPSEIIGVYPGALDTLLVCQHGDVIYSVYYPNNLKLQIFRSEEAYYGETKKSNEE